MHNGPGKVVSPQETTEFADWQDFRREGESQEFPDYDDSTRSHIMNGETQHFHYEGNNLPEKM